MAETELTSTETDALEGTTDSDLAFVYHALGDSTFNVNGTRQAEKLARLAKALGNRFRVYQDGAATYGIRPGKVEYGDTTLSYAGSTGNALTDNQTNYIWLYNNAGTLTIDTSTSDFPDSSTTPHLPLATIAIASGSYDHADITDYRQLCCFRLNSAMTAANENTLVGGTSSNADALHTHARAGLTQDDAAVYRIPLQNCRSNTGLVLDATGGDTLFSIANGGIGVGTLTLQGEEAVSETETTTLCFEFALPPEYVASETVTVAVECKVDESGAGNAITETIAMEAYELGDDGTVGANLASGGAQDMSGGGDTFNTYTSTITDAGLVAGDKLLLFVQTVITEDAGTAVYAVIGNIEVRLDIKG